jgi:hypothetical protein
MNIRIWVVTLFITVCSAPLLFAENPSAESHFNPAKDTAQKIRRCGVQRGRGFRAVVERYLLSSLNRFTASCTNLRVSCMAGIFLPSGEA